jgi:hypothetical protein
MDNLGSEQPVRKRAGGKPDDGYLGILLLKIVRRVENGP